MLRTTALLAVLAAIAGVDAAPSDKHRGDSLASIEHIVLFMQENRAFDHYYGTMAGVRGFSDPNVVIASDTGKPSFFNPVDKSTGADFLVPWWFNHQGGNANDRFQCSVAGSNGWEANRAALDGGNVNKWATKNTPYSLGYYRRQDIPTLFDINEGWTMSDAYHESIYASTTPNRISWVGGTIGVGLSKQGLGGPAVDNHESPGCEIAPNGDKYSCYPYKWKTVAEYLNDVGISWQVYQDTDNFDDNPFAWFEQFQKAPKNSKLAKNGMGFLGLNKFYSDAKKGKLPQVSFIIGPTQLSEHTPYGPLDGAWLQRKVIDSIVSGAAYDKSALLISYDETGGWADHVPAPHPDQSVTDEWMTDPFNPSLGPAVIGPGFRVPFAAISPWTRSGGVFSEVSAHESQILFLEKWAAAKGKAFTMNEVTQWRRQHLSDLTRMFDFSKKDMSLPNLAGVREATKDPVSGTYNGAATCHLKYGGGQPDVPYGVNVTDGWNWAAETGFKKVRGNPNEGHYYVFVNWGQALTFADNHTYLSNVPQSYDDPNQRWIVWAVNDTPDNTQFYLQPNNNRDVFLKGDGSVVGDKYQGQVFTISDSGNGKGYKFDCGGCQVAGLLKSLQLVSVSYN